MMLDLAAEFIDLDQPDPLGRTILSNACFRLNPGLLRLLLDRGENPRMRNKLGNRTCLHTAVDGLNGRHFSFDEENCKVSLKILLEAGLCPTDEDDFGVTPLDLAHNLCFARRRILEEALTECGIEFDGLIGDDEECPGVYHNKKPYCYCDPNWRTKFRDDNRRCKLRRNSSAFESSQDNASEEYEDDSSEALDDASEDETASAHSICYPDLQLNHRSSEVCPQLEEEDERFIPGRIRHFDTERQALWSSWPQTDAVWNNDSTFNNTANATNPDAQLYASIDRDATTEADPWNNQTLVATPLVVHDHFTYSSTSAWASESITNLHCNTIKECEGPPTAGCVEEVNGPD
jgi:hypothetical protein